MMSAVEGHPSADGSCPDNFLTRSEPLLFFPCKQTGKMVELKQSKSCSRIRMEKKLWIPIGVYPVSTAAECRMQNLKLTYLLSHTQFFPLTVGCNYLNVHENI